MLTIALIATNALSLPPAVPRCTDVLTTTPHAATRRSLLAFSVGAVFCPSACTASNAGALAAKARAAERKLNEGMGAAPINQLQRAASSLDVVEELLRTAADAGLAASRWGEFRDVLAPGIVSVRVYCPKKGAIGARRAAFLSAASELDQFAYDQQLKNLRDKYPQGYAQFKARNLNLDVSEPTAALERARGALDALLASAREEEWGVAVSIEL